MGNAVNDTISNRPNQIKFFESIIEEALRQEKLTGIPWQVTLGQAAEETGWGSKMPVDAYTGAISNNLYGIKYTGDKALTAQYVRAWTPEVIKASDLETWKAEHAKWALNGDALKIKVNNGATLEIEVIQPFRVFDSANDSLAGHSDTLGKDVYKAATQYKNDPFKYLQTISSIYATNPSYYNNVSTIMFDYLEWAGKPNHRPNYRG